MEIYNIRSVIKYYIDFSGFVKCIKFRKSSVIVVNFSCEILVIRSCKVNISNIFLIKKICFYCLSRNRSLM